MGWNVSLFTLIVFGGALVAIGVGFATLRQRPHPLVWPLTLTMFAVAAWAIPHAISFGYRDVGQVVFWHQVRYPGTVIAPVGYFVVALRYAGYERWLSRRVYALLAVIPAITLVVVWIFPSSGLFWRSLAITQVGGASVLMEEFGPWYWINLGYLYLVTVGALFVIGAVVVRSGAIYRKQALLMFVGGLVPLATNAVINFGVGPYPMVDLTTSALAVSGLTFALALFHLDLLEIRLVARDRLLDELDDGVVVIGPNGQIRDFNPTAALILRDIKLGQPAEKFLPSEVTSDGGELTTETIAGDRRFNIRSTALTDGHGHQIGRIIYLNDTTEIVEREQRVSVLNRVLRHNIRNELNFVSGHLEMLEQHALGVQCNHVETAKQGVQRVIEFAEKARYLERTIHRSDRMMVVSAVEIVERVATEAQETYTNAVVEYKFPEAPGNGSSVCVIDDELFEMAIAELVENAVIHNDRESPQVIVRVEPNIDQVQVSVADNGPGIPDHEKDALTSRLETPLHHSSGLGLWLVKWTASLSSGELSFSENDPRGAVVTLTLLPS